MTDMLSIKVEKLFENKEPTTKEIRLYVVDGVDRSGPRVAYLRNDPDDMGGIGGGALEWDPLHEEFNHQFKYLSNIPNYTQEYIVKEVLGGSVQLGWMKSVDLSTFRVLLFKRETYQKDTFDGVINIGK